MLDATKKARIEHLADQALEVMRFALHHGNEPIATDAANVWWACEEALNALTLPIIRLACGHYVSGPQRFVQHGTTRFCFECKNHQEIERCRD
jgi:hypothetical protein